MARNGYLDRLRAVPGLGHCSRRQLELLAGLVDIVELPAGTLELDGRELVVTLDPVRALVVSRRALPVVLALAPGLAGAQTLRLEPEPEPGAGRARPALRLHPA